MAGFPASPRLVLLRLNRAPMLSTPPLLRNFPTFHSVPPGELSKTRGSGLFMCNEQCLRVRDSRFDVGGAGDSWITAKGHFAISRYPAPLTTSPSLRPHRL
jgi:hypothetical protein